MVGPILPKYSRKLEMPDLKDSPSESEDAIKQQLLPGIDAELANEYSDSSFWQKLQRFANVAGRVVVERALWLYYAAQRPDVPVWARTVIYTALAYFILPADAIPDFTPAAGYADDLGALLVALTTVAAYITPDIRQQAKDKLEEWFGETE